MTEETKKPDFKIWRKSPSGTKTWLTTKTVTWTEDSWSADKSKAHVFEPGQEHMLSLVDDLADAHEFDMGYSEVGPVAASA